MCATSRHRLMCVVTHSTNPIMKMSHIFFLSSGITTVCQHKLLSMHKFQQIIKTVNQQSHHFGDRAYTRVGVLRISKAAVRLAAATRVHPFTPVSTTVNTSPVRSQHSRLGKTTRQADTKQRQNFPHNHFTPSPKYNV